MQIIFRTISIITKRALFALLFLFLFSSICEAGAMDKLDIEAEAEFKFSHFDRTPEPTLTSTGNNFSQEYRMYLDGKVLKSGVLNSSFGVLFPDKYRTNDVDLENRVRFDYGKRFRFETLKKHETDEDIFFSTTTTAPQSPIHTETNSYDTGLALGSHSKINYSFKTIERDDVLLGTVIGEKTGSQSIRFTSDFGALKLDGEYQTRDFQDNIGGRSDIDSEDMNFEVFYQPKDFLSITGNFDESTDKDLDNDTKLNSKESGMEISLKIFKELKVRNRWRLINDADTKTEEDISNNSNELILNFDPSKKIGFEMAYKREAEDKKRASVEDIDSTINEGRFRMKLVPFSTVNFFSGYEITDKSSSSSTENTKDIKLYSNVSFEPWKAFRMGIDFSNLKRKNTFSSVIESNTTSTAASVQYRPKQSISLFLRADTTETENPATGSFTKTDMIGSNLDIDVTSFFNVVLRTSIQETTGSSEASASERMLNSLELKTDVLKNLNLVTKYEIIDSSGTSGSDENLMDLAAFYHISRFDFSLRFQDRRVTGANPNEKSTMLSNIKYKFHRNAALSFRVSFVDFSDNMTPANSYDSNTYESFLSMRF